MAGAPTVVKAKLSLETGQEIECLFAPKDYAVTKANSWKTEAKPGITAPKPAFQGGTPWEMNLELLLDSTLIKPALTVKKTTEMLFDAMNATQGEAGKKNTKRPPTLRFQFGTFSFVGVIKSLKVAFVLFKPDGEPIRANVTLGLVQWDEKPVAGQNPTTRAETVHGSHVIRDGDSLPSIAHRAYGDPTQWRVIARANGIDDPLKLRSGRTLEIPELYG